MLPTWGTKQQQQQQHHQLGRQGGGRWREVTSPRGRETPQAVSWSCRCCQGNNAAAPCGARLGPPCSPAHLPARRCHHHVTSAPSPRQTKTQQRGGEKKESMKDRKGEKKRENDKPDNCELCVVLHASFVLTKRPERSLTDPYRPNRDATA